MVGQQIIYTVDGDIADDLALRYWGSDASVLELYAANPNLIDFGAVFPAGVAVSVPRRIENAPKTIERSVRLW